MFKKLRKLFTSFKNLRIIRNHRCTSEEFLTKFFNEREFEGVKKEAVLKFPSQIRWHMYLYILIRLQRPKLVIETGVAHGASSLVILQALEDNKIGELISIDKPGGVEDWVQKVPDGKVTGWLVPEELKHRHTLILGDSKRVLPEIVKSVSNIDVFLHDSLHTYDHMLFEYETVWDKISENGLLLTHNVYQSFAFYDFSRKVKREFCSLNALGMIKK